MIQWEYGSTTVDGTIEESVPSLDNAGREGWEVIGFHPNPYGITYLFKRPLPVAAAEGTEVKHSHSTRFMCSRTCPQYGTANEITGY